MSKKIVVGLVLCSMLVASGAFAQIRVQWSGTSGFFAADDSSQLLDPFPGQSALAQLVWTPDFNGGVAAGADIGGGTLGNEQVLAERWITSNPWAEVSAATYTDLDLIPVEGWVYARIFDGVDSQDTALITAGLDYYWGPFMLLEEVSGTEFQVYDMHRGLSEAFGGADFVGGDQPQAVLDAMGTNQVIPEPSVFALLGLGGLLLVIRRRFYQS